MGDHHAGGKSHHGEHKKKKKGSGHHDESADDGQLSQAMTRKEMWSDAHTLGFFVNTLAHAWAYPGEADDLVAQVPDSAMRDALANMIILRGYLHDGKGDIGMTKLAMDTWSGSVKKTFKHALDILGTMPDINLNWWRWGQWAFNDVTETLAEQYKYSDEKEAEEGGAGGGIKTPKQTSKKEKAEVTKALEMGKELADNARETVAGLSGDEQFETAASTINNIYEIVTGTGELVDKLKNADGALQNMQAIDEVLQYAIKVLETLTTTIFGVGAKFASGETAKFLEEMSEGFGKRLGQGAAVLQIVSSALDCIDKISEGDWEGAADAAVDTGEGVVMLLVPESGPVFAGAALWWFEIKALTAATADFLTMIDDDRKNSAVAGLLGPAQRMVPFAQGLGQSLEAWSKRVGDKSLDPDVLRREADLLMLSIESDTEAITGDLATIHKQLTTKDDFHVGGHADLMKAYEVGTYNAAPESKINPDSLGAKGWKPPKVVFDRKHFGDMPGFVRALMHGVQSVASVAGGDAVEARTARMTDLMRMDSGEDIREGDVVKIGLPFNTDSEASTLEVTGVRVDSTNDAFKLVNNDYAKHLKSAQFADSADQINHPIQLRFSPFGADTYNATVTVDVAFPDGHSETRSLHIKQDYGV